MFLHVPKTSGFSYPRLLHRLFNGTKETSCFIVPSEDFMEMRLAGAQQPHASSGTQQQTPLSRVISSGAQEPRVLLESSIAALSVRRYVGSVLLRPRTGSTTVLFTCSTLT